MKSLPRCAWLACMALLLARPAMALDLRDYWPSPPAGDQLLVQSATDTGDGPRKAVLRRYVKRGPANGAPVDRMEEYGRYGLLSIWEYRDDGGQVVEVGTWQGAMHKVYKPGKGIPWGGAQQVGDVIERALEVDVEKSHGVAPSYWNFGYQKVTLAALLPSFTTAGGQTFADVVKLCVFQSWCANPGCSYPSGQEIVTLIYWLAPGLGPIQIEYLSPVSRVDYAVGTAQTWEIP